MPSVSLIDKRQSMLQHHKTSTLNTSCHLCGENAKITGKKNVPRCVSFIHPHCRVILEFGIEEVG